ncbi:MAG: hypothetical protein AB8B69_03645 [Chitinophagales bacterium]
MMTENKRIELIENYVLNTFSNRDLQLLTQLRRDEPAIEEEITFFENLYGGAVLFGDERFKMELQQMEINWQLKRKKAEQSSLRDKLSALGDKANEVMLQFGQFFLPVPNYETVLWQTSRSTSAGLTAPKNGADIEGEFTYRFEKPLVKNHRFVLENNSQEVLEERTLEKGTTQFVVDIAGFSPGRYYWKLIGERETLIGMFFVGRNNGKT